MHRVPFCEPIVSNVLVSPKLIISLIQYPKKLLVSPQKVHVLLHSDSYCPLWQLLGVYKIQPLKRATCGGISGAFFF